MKHFDGHPDQKARFRLTDDNEKLTLRGCDSDGDPFRLQLDQLWASTLRDEIDDWLANG